MGTNKAKFDAIISDYGTHFFSSVTLGGKLTLKTRMSSCVQKGCHSYLLKAEAEASFDKGVKSVSANTDQEKFEKQCSSSAASSKSSRLNVLGGSSQTCSNAQCDQALWQKSVTVSDPGSLQVISAIIKPLWETISLTDDNSIY